ncbi:hypothetical protein [Cupriavidus basilensis]|jgi:hypothetical protein|uniref:hypothetical protein n=1 Tax=Cupriavidus basilensis TaxID=68895 RepID=UPI001F515547|nr:hypothetical protein [Cupriavidus basilensis]
MTAALALHVAVHCVVPPGMSSRCMASRTRACRARAFAPHFTRHFARHSALLSDVPLIAPQAGDSLRIGVQPVVLSGVFALIQVPCRCTWRARAFARYAALHSAQPSKVQASCLEHAGPVALAAFAGALAAHAAAPPGRSGRERMREANAEGKTKGFGTCRPAKPVCTWGWRDTQQLRHRAAWGAKPAPMRACPRASHARTRQNLQGAQP